MDSVVIFYGFCGYLPRILWLLLSTCNLRDASASKKSYAIGFIAGFEINATKNPTMSIHDLPRLISKPSQDLQSPQLSRGATLAHDPLCFVSEAQGEQVVKLLQLIAGDVETNPGPMAVSLSFYQPSTSIMFFLPGSAARC